MRRRLGRLAGGLLLASAGLLGLLVVEALLARRGPAEAFVEAPRTARAFGTDGPELSYVVMGDSTGAGQGAAYDDGIAVATARHLAATRRVRLVNLSISGTKLADVAAEQLPLALRARPDAVLVSAGANDVTGLTRTGKARDELTRIARELRAARPGVAIVVTLSPDMGSTPRLAQPLRWVAGARTGQLNRALREVVKDQRLELAPIAAVTGPQFRRDPSLFAADRFHPNARGYTTWVPPLTAALDRALR